MLHPGAVLCRYISQQGGNDDWRRCHSARHPRPWSRPTKERSPCADTHTPSSSCGLASSADRKGHTLLWLVGDALSTIWCMAYPTHWRLGSKSRHWPDAAAGVSKAVAVRRGLDFRVGSTAAGQPSAPHGGELLRGRTVSPILGNRQTVADRPTEMRCRVW